MSFWLHNSCWKLEGWTRKPYTSLVTLVSINRPSYVGPQSSCNQHFRWRLCVIVFFWWRFIVGLVSCGWIRSLPFSLCRRLSVVWLDFVRLRLILVVLWVNVVIDLGEQMTNTGQGTMKTANLLQASLVWKFFSHEWNGMECSLVSRELQLITVYIVKVLD